MDPADSVKVSRDSTYSGATQETDQFRVRDSHPLRPTRSNAVPLSICFLTHEEWSYNPKQETRLVWALPISLAATDGIDFSFSSTRYLDVSVPWVRHIHLWIQCMSVRVPPDQCLFNDSPKLFAVFRALQRLLMPRHPLCALHRLIAGIEYSYTLNDTTIVRWQSCCNVI